MSSNVLPSSAVRLQVCWRLSCSLARFRFFDVTAEQGSFAPFAALQEMSGTGGGTEEPEEVLTSVVGGSVLDSSAGLSEKSVPSMFSPSFKGPTKKCAWKASA